MEQDHQITDSQVVKALYERAIGSEVENLEVVTDENNKKRLKRLRRQYPPDTPAIMFLLKNRRPEEWRTKPAPVEREIVVRRRPIPVNRNADLHHS
jgi:hypothetical protein